MSITGGTSTPDPLRQQFGLICTRQPDKRKQAVCVLRGKRLRFGHPHQLAKLVHIDSVGGSEPQQKSNARLASGGRLDNG